MAVCGLIFIAEYREYSVRAVDYGRLMGDPISCSKVLPFNVLRLGNRQDLTLASAYVTLVALILMARANVAAATSLS